MTNGGGHPPKEKPSDKGGASKPQSGDAQDKADGKR